MSSFITTSYIDPNYWAEGYVADDVYHYSIYQDLITSEHADKLRFFLTVGASTNPFLDIMSSYVNMMKSFDIDVAVGDQLDKIGEWIGIGRALITPITNVYFTFNTGPGFDKGMLLGEGGSSSSVTVLDDIHYRLLLKVKIMNNHWDGSMQHFYDISAQLFRGIGYTLFIKDNANLTVDLGFIESGVSPIAIALLIGGYLDLKPATVTIANYIYTL